MTLPKVLIIEKSSLIRQLFGLHLSNSGKLIFAGNLEEVKKAIDENTDFALTAVEGNLANKGEGVRIVKYLKTIWCANTIIAISYKDETNSQLIKAGADEKINKANSFKYLKEKLTEQSS